MTRCPYCKALSNPLRFVTYSRWSPYECRKCGGRSKFNTRAITVLGGVATFITIALYRSVPGGLLTCLIVGMVAIMLFQWLFLKLQPIPEEDASPNNRAEQNNDDDLKRKREALKKYGIIK